MLHTQPSDKVYEALKSVASYRSQLRAIIRSLWQGATNIYEAFASFSDAKDNAFDRAWAEGMKSVGMSFPEDMTIEEIGILREAKINEQQYIFPFLEVVEANSKANKGKLTPLLDRVDKWMVRYNTLISRAVQMSKSDPKLIWETHSVEECGSCQKLNGQVRRASFWRSKDLHPNTRRLECVTGAGGIPVCKCTLKPTDFPVSKGRFPNV